MGGHYINLTGQRFGRLTVLGLSTSKIKKWHRFWFCQCDCGNHAVVESSVLKGGQTASCGCLRKETTSIRRKLPDGLSQLHIIYNNYKYEAKKRRFEFNLTVDQFAILTKGNCFYCGQVPSRVRHDHDLCASYVYNGVDRVDTQKGYTPDNVVPCCAVCNRAKLALSRVEFLSWVRRVYNWNKKPRTLPLLM